MADIDNVIRGIKHESRNSGKCGHYCPEEYAAKCPYDTDGLCIIHWGADAIALLKAQEPKTVVVEDIPEGESWFGIWFGRCPNCNEQLVKKEHKHFCGHCGQAVKWK